MIFNQQKEPFIITTELEVKNMVSDDCARKIENILNVTRGIKNTTDDFDSKQLKVTYDENVTDIDKIKQVVHRLGYEAS